MLAKRKQEPEAVPEITEFEVARAAWTEIRDKHRDFTERMGGMKMALNLVAATTDDGNSRVPQALKDQAKPYMPLARRRPEKLVEQFRDTDDEFQVFQPTFFDAKLEWDQAQQRETNKQAALLQPRQRVAVKAIADALEALSRALADEMEIHDELRARAPLAISANLPTLGAEFLDIAVSNWDSRAWRWRRKVKELGIIK